MTPKRIQRKRTKGWRMPPNTVYVGRPSKWGNPFLKVGLIFGTPVTTLYQIHLLYSIHGKQLVEEAKKELCGKNLACWCPLDRPCHADILLEIANEVA